MTPFASVALIRRLNGVVFKPPRKERPTEVTQARKAAARYWRAGLVTGDTLVKLIVLREYAGRLQISERGHNNGHDKPWVEYDMDVSAAVREPHLAACLAELGVDPARAAPPMPDVLEVNGIIYRREI